MSFTNDEITKHKISASLIGVFFAILFFSIGFAILDKYGITWDEPENFYVGTRYLGFFSTLDKKYLDFDKDLWAIQNNNRDVGLDGLYFTSDNKEFTEINFKNADLKKCNQMSFLIDKEFIEKHSENIKDLGSKKGEKYFYLMCWGNIFFAQDGVYIIGLDNSDIASNTQNNINVQALFGKSLFLEIKSGKITRLEPLEVKRGFYRVLFKVGFPYNENKAAAVKFFWITPYSNFQEIIPSYCLYPGLLYWTVPDKTVFSEKNLRPTFPNDHHPERYLPVANTLSALFEKVFTDKLGILSIVDSRHLSIIFLASVFLFFMYIFLSAYFGEIIAVISTISLFLFPAFIAHSHNNIKDIPGLVFFSLTCFSSFHAVCSQKLKWFIISGILWGLALGTKANAVILPIVIIIWLIIEFIVLKKNKIPWAFKTKPFFITLIIGLSVFILSWPYLWGYFDSSIFMKHFMKFFEYYSNISQAPRGGITLQPFLYLFCQTPPFLLFLFGIGLYDVIRRGCKEPEYLLFVVWFFVPIIRICMPNMNYYDGIRHYIEVIVPLCIIAGFGSFFVIDLMLKFLKNKLILKLSTGVLFFLYVLSLVLPVRAYHPYENTYFNFLAGGLRGAQHFLPYSTDYWGSSYREAVLWLNKNAPENSRVIPLIAPHLLKYSNLRSDINNVRSYFGPSRTYFMFITRPDFYTPEMKYIVKNKKPIFQIKRGGGDILNIYEQ